ncbi:MAG: FtsX-like permease family protein, partial [Eubacteriales bacterium]|nr:FtsX-like permease family protein [Eubacteriales bacterium]
GVISLQNQLSQIDGDSALFLPISVFCELMGGTVQELTLSVRRGDTPRQTADEAIRALETRAGRTAQAMTMQVQIEAANSVIVLFVDVLKWVAFICILVGGIGVMNILLVSVRERRREIGVMKSLGASEAQICALFLLEAFQYAAVGGVLGVLTGFGLIRLAAGAIGLSPVVKPGDVLTVAAAATAIGLLFGVAPASSAARMAPVDALRE